MQKKTAKDRFDEKWKLDESTGCWVWRAFVHPGGYGRFSLRCKFVMAHRAAYELYVGEIPNGMQVLHACDRPACVNPAHLRLGTREENMRERDARHRQSFGAKNGNARITDLIAQKIFDDPRPRRLIAERYRVSLGTVQMIKNKRRWAHIHTAPY